MIFEKCIEIEILTQYYLISGTVARLVTSTLSMCFIKLAHSLDMNVGTLNTPSE